MAGTGARRVEPPGAVSWLAGRGVKLLSAGHRIGIHVFAAPEGEAVVSALDLEPELLIESDSSGVVDVHGEFDAREVEPVIRQVQGRLHQRGADAPALPVIAHSHADLSHVPPAPKGGKRPQA